MHSYWHRRQNQEVGGGGGGRGELILFTMLSDAACIQLNHEVA